MFANHVKFENYNTRAQIKGIKLALEYRMRKRKRPVHGELTFKLLREAGIALGSESANGSYSMWFAVWDCHQLHQPAYHRRVRYGCDVGCEASKSASFLSKSAEFQNSVWSRNSRRIVPISRSTKGCDSGVYGTVLISATPRILKFACHW